LFAEFIKWSAAVIGQPYFFVVSGNCKKGLLHHMGMSPKFFFALLLATNFIRFGSNPFLLQEE